MAAYTDPTSTLLELSKAENSASQDIYPTPNHGIQGTHVTGLKIDMATLRVRRVFLLLKSQFIGRIRHSRSISEGPWNLRQEEGSYKMKQGWAG